MSEPTPEATFRLSPLQEGMLFNTLAAPASGVDLLVGVLELDEELDEARFQESWLGAVRRHPALRTRFRWQGVDAAVQDVLPDSVLPVRRVDWSDLEPDEQERRWSDLVPRDRAEGFELTRAPLTRLTLVRLGPARWRVLWPIHHALVDTLSMLTVLREVFEAYDGGAEAAPAAVTQRDYSRWLETAELDGAEAFWRGELGGLDGPTRPAPDAGPPAGEDVGVFALRRVRWEAERTSALRERAAAHEWSLNTLLQAAWALVLARSSGERRVVFGAVKSCRRSFSKDAGAMVGLVLNTLPLVVDVDPGARVGDWVGAVRGAWVALRPHEHTPLASIKQWSGFDGRLPVFESVLCFDPMEYTEALEAGGGDWSTRRFDIFGQPEVPLTLNVYGGRHLQLRATYDPRRFSAAVVDGLLEQLETALEALVQGADGRVAELSTLSERERERVVETWNRTAVELPPSPATLDGLVREQAARTPDAPAVTERRGGAERSVSYAELAERARRFAATLRARGVGPDQGVGLCVERSIDMVVGMLGILEAGGGYVPLDPTFPVARLGEMAAAAALELVVVHAETRELAASIHSGLELVELGQAPDAAGVADPELDGASADRVAYVLFTSGSTGRPKGVAMPHGPLVNLVRWQCAESEPAPRTLQFAPPGFDVSCQEVFATLAAGGELVVAPDEVRRDPAALLELVDERGVERVFLPFVALQELAEAAVGRGLFPGALKEVVTAGEALQVGPALRELFRRLPACRLANQYGPTECHVVTAHTLTGEPDAWPDLPPIGRPIANARAYVLDPAGAPVPAGVTGELYLGGAAVARGYVGDARRTAERFVADPFVGTPSARMYRTGDLARHRADGVLEFLGRDDDQVKLRGFRVELGEVEAGLLAHPEVAQARVAVRGTGDRRRLVAWVVGSPGAQELEAAELRSFLAERLPEFMLPAELVQLDAMPLGPTGKVDRDALPDPGPDVRRAAEFAAPSSDTERFLADLWCELLEQTRVGLDDDFFELGGNSILAMRTVSRIRDAFGVEVAVRRLSTDATVGRLAEHVDTLLWVAGGGERDQPGDLEELEL